MRRRTTLIGAMLVKHGFADALLCGTFGRHSQHLRYVDEVLGKRDGIGSYYTINMLVMSNRTLFIGDTNVNYDPTAAQIAEMTLLASEQVRRFGLVPKVALLSYSNFGNEDTPTARKMRDALAIIQQAAPQLEVDGEMHGDAALSAAIREQIFPGSQLSGEANLLVMPTVDAANISYSLLKTVAGDGLTIGPLLLGAARPVHILTPTATVRRIVNLTALLSVEASKRD
jgi:malate dehydrogenase (oxaloacetate-decarboxylating)(NADP+)